MPPQSESQALRAGAESARLSPPADAPSVSATARHGDGIALAAASFFEAGLKLIESFAENATNNGKADAPAKRLDHTLSGLFTRDVQTNRPTLTIPMPESVTEERLAGALSALLAAFGKS